MLIELWLICSGDVDGYWVGKNAHVSSSLFILTYIARLYAASAFAKPDLMGCKHINTSNHSAVLRILHELERMRSDQVGSSVQ